MQKSILALLVLLFLLILTCVYQKTDVLYAKYNETTPKPLATISPTPLPLMKKEPIPLMKKEPMETKVDEKVAEELAVEKSAEKKEIKITKSETEVVKTPVIRQKIATAPPPASTSAKQKDIEEIDTLMRALKDREVAFKNRDAFELHLQQLIKKALENRSAAITHMNKEELHLIELQKELLKARDIAYEKIGQTIIPTSGE